ncbi:hypothetical protein KQH40_00145 [bacterium]|nr:hypothetical protein [bacterium]
MSTEESYLEQISKSLGQIARLKAVRILQSEDWVGKPNGEKIYFLHQLDFTNDDIATMIGTTKGTVQKEISVRKK